MKDLGIEIASRVIQIHDIKDESQIDVNINNIDMTEKINLIRCLNKGAEKDMVKVIDNAKARGDSVGGVFEIIATVYMVWDLAAGIESFKLKFPLC